ncbi:MAG: hypothetical protein E7603_07535 [Ruminococcaceae bacterium]|nr:hypothetical protein [Oscillospiraceae bacterium]
MGFAWMFLGYVLLLGTNFEIFGVTLDITPDVVGFLLLSHGFSVASRYCDCFKISKILGNVGIPLSLVYLISEVSFSMELLPLAPGVVSAVKYGYAFFKLIFSLCLLYSLYLISAQTGVEKLRKKSIRLALYTVLFFFAEHCFPSLLSLAKVSMEASKIAGIQMFLNILCILINATLIFGCYMWICLEGDEDMPDNRKHKYKTPFDYFDKRRSEASSAQTAQRKENRAKQHKRK